MPGDVLLEFLLAGHSGGADGSKLGRVADAFEKRVVIHGGISAVIIINRAAKETQSCVALPGFCGIGCEEVLIFRIAISPKVRLSLLCDYSDLRSRAMFKK